MMQEPLLSDIYSQYASETDKGSVHSYIDLYETLLAEYRHRPITLVEIGVWRGGSLKLWRRYLHPASRVIGIDKAGAPAVDGAEVIQADATQPDWIAKTPPPDVVIDDGSHLAHEQIATYRLLWPLVRPEGLYVIEDIQHDIALQCIREVIPGACVVDWRQTAKQHFDNRLVWIRKSPARPAPPLARHKIIVLNAQNENYAHIYRLTEANKRAYCARYGYEFRAEWFGQELQRRPHWGRVHAIRKHLPECDWLLYLDTDIVITNPLFRVESYITSQYDLVIGRMPSPKHVSTSALLLRNCDWAYRMLDAWWNSAVDVWHSDSDATRGGGPFVDQSGWHKLYDTTDWVRERTWILPPQVRAFNSESWSWQPGDWLLHVPGISVADKYAELQRRLQWTQSVPWSINWPS